MNKKQLIEALELKGNKLSPLTKACILEGITITPKDIKAFKQLKRVAPRKVTCYKCDREYISDLADAGHTKCAWCYL